MSKRKRPSRVTRSIAAACLDSHNMEDGWMDCRILVVRATRARVYVCEWHTRGTHGSRHTGHASRHTDNLDKHPDPSEQVDRDRDRDWSGGPGGVPGPRPPGGRHVSAVSTHVTSMRTQYTVSQSGLLVCNACTLRSLPNCELTGRGSAPRPAPVPRGRGSVISYVAYRRTKFREYSIFMITYVFVYPGG
jgi:hypothetical protein